MSSFSLYGSWSIEEAGMVGKTFMASCIADYGYEITKGKEYLVKVEPRIMPGSPLCSFKDDQGKSCIAHLERFEKIELVDA
jgi:hypothetical protein